MINTGVLKRNPFPGIRPFKSSEDKYFFGRDAAISEITGLLQKNRFIALVGASAIGKTSLIQSGVIPSLLNGEKEEWIPVSVRPGNNPVENLVRGFQKVFPKKLSESDVKAFLSGSRDLADLLVEKGLGSHKYFLVVDQYEDLFRRGTGQRADNKQAHTSRYVDLLVRAVRSERPSVHVMISIRSDYMEASSGFRALTELMNKSKYILPQMSGEALSDCILGPVQEAGARLEPGFAEYVLEDLEDLDTPLPLLQHAMMRTWETWGKQDDLDLPISIGDYQSIGTVKSALSGHLEETYSQLDEKQKSICERFFKTITEKGEHHSGHSRQVSLGNVARIAHCGLEELVEVVEAFRQPGRAFLSPGPTGMLTGDSVVEVAHESMIRIWDRLGKWVDEEDESVKMYLRLSESSALYQQGRTELLKNPDLQLAVTWRDAQKPSPAWGVQYHPAFERAMVYLKTSEEEHMWEEERKAILQRRRLFLNRAVAVFMGVLVVVLAVVFLTTRDNSPDQPDANQGMAQDLPVTEGNPAPPAGSVNPVSGPGSDPATLPEQQAAGDEVVPEISDAGVRNAGDPATGARDSRIGSETDDDERQGTSSRNAVSPARTSTSERVSDNRANQRNPTSGGSAADRTNESSRTVSGAGTSTAAGSAAARRTLEVARSVARESAGLTQNPDLQGLLAYQAYQLNAENNGAPYDRDIYNGLYAALKKLISPAYNIYPNLRSSIKDLQWLQRTGSMIAVSSDGSVKILSGTFANRASQIALRNTGQNNECITVSPDEQMAAVGTVGGGLLFIELENQGAVVHRSSEGGNTVLFLCKLGSTGDFLAAGTENRILQWNYDTKTPAVLTETEARPSSLAASGDGRKVSYGTRTGSLVELDPEAPGTKKQIGDFTGSYVQAIAYSPGGNTLVAGMSNGSIRVLSGMERRTLASLQGPGAGVTDLAYSPDGRYLAASSRDGNVYLWTSANWNEPPLVFDENNGFVLSVCFSGSGGFFYSGSVDYPRLIGRPASSDQMVRDFCSLVSRNLTMAEWDQYFGGDIPYRQTCPGKN